MKKGYTVDQVEKISANQRTLIGNECKLIAEFLKKVPRTIDLKKELPQHDFKGQTIDDGSDVNFVSGEYKHQYVQIKDEFVLTGCENEMIIKTTYAYVISSDEKIYFVQDILVFANPIISNEEIKVRVGHYFLIATQTMIHYQLNREINHSFRKGVDRLQLKERVAEYFLNQKIKFKLTPISKEFKHDNPDTIKMLIKEGILNKKDFFKKLASRNAKFLIVREVVTANENFNRCQVIAVKGKKKALAGMYFGEELEVVIVTKTLYIKLGDTKVCLGKTEQVFPKHKFPRTLTFSSINYNEDCWHTNIPQMLEFK